jgi:hypothetical protein
MKCRFELTYLKTIKPKVVGHVWYQAKGYEV